MYERDLIILVISFTVSNAQDIYRRHKKTQAVISPQRQRDNLWWQSNMEMVSVCVFMPISLYVYLYVCVLYVHMYAYNLV